MKDEIRKQIIKSLLKSHYPLTADDIIVITDLLLKKMYGDGEHPLIPNLYQKDIDDMVLTYLRWNKIKKIKNKIKV